VRHFTTETLFSIVKVLQKELLTLDVHDVISFEVLNPDILVSHYSGSSLTCKDVEYTYRSYKSWTDLAQLLFCRMLTPHIKSDDIVEIRFQKLNTTASFHTTGVDEVKEKYGVDSTFFEIHKNEEASFLLAYSKALEAVKIENRKEILNLGINGGDEFALIKEIVPSEIYSSMNLIGIDYSASAIAFASKRFSEENVTCKEHDINDLASLALKRSDLIISIGTLQSPGINFKILFMSLVQNHLTDNGAFILGFPNSRWMDGEMVYGAKAPNYSYSEMSLVIKDIHWCKKYLQQHKFRVTLTGKDYIFLTATKIGLL